MGAGVTWKNEWLLCKYHTVYIYEQLEVGTVGKFTKYEKLKN